MKSFKQYLLEQEKVEITKPTPNIGSGQVKAKVKEEEPTSKPKEELKTKNSAEDPFGGDETVKKFYRAFSAAEHRNVKLDNPFDFDERVFIRTRGSTDSSAYGPVQITGKTVSGFYKQNPAAFKGVEDYTTKFIDQGRKFLKAEKQDQTYGLGCKGDLCSPEQNASYQKMAAAVIRGKMKEAGVDPSKPLKPEDIEKVVDHWRYGLGSGKSTKTSDKAYHAAFMQAYNS